jgi:hypothetical protein
MGTAGFLALDCLLTNHFRSRNRRLESRIASSRTYEPGALSQRLTTVTSSSSYPSR